MESIDVSIIIPYYNNIDDLERLLASIGTHSNVEVLVINDRSNENLDKYNIVIREYNKIGYKFINNTSSNKGAGVARNIGIINAKGEWFLFADSDDYFADNWYENVYPYIKSDYDIVFFSPKCNKDNQSKIGIRGDRYRFIINEYLRNKNVDETQLRYFFSVPWSKLIKKNLVLNNNIRFDEIPFSNDVMFSLKTGFYAKKLTATNSVIYCVTLANSKSLTSNKSLSVFNLRAKVVIRQHNFLYKHLGNFFYLEKHPLGMMEEIICNNYGLKVYLKYFKIFKKMGIPVLHLIPFNKYKIKYYLKRLVFLLFEFINQIFTKH